MIKKEILEHIEKLVRYSLTEESLLNDKLALHFCINMIRVEESLQEEKLTLLPELEKIDKSLHPAQLYQRVSPGHWCVPDYDDIQFYCGMTPDNRYWTMDFDDKKQEYHLWDYVYITPPKYIKQHIENHWKDYAYRNMGKLKWLKQGIGE